MDNYEINRNTIALIPINEVETKVYEKNKTFIVTENTMKIITNSCLSFGSTYLGRHNGTKKLIGISHKAPIIIEETRNIIYFPTTSPRLKNCCWISLNYIKEYKEFNDRTLITFENDSKVEIDISINSFDNQYLRATKLEYALRKKLLNF